MSDSTAAPAATARPVAAAFLDVLAEEGYRPKLDRDCSDENTSCIAFKSERTTYLLFAYEDDPEYLRVGVSYDLGEGPDDAAALAALANRVNDQVKGVKTVLAPDDHSVRFVVETFLTGQRVSGALVERALGALRKAADDFFEARRPPERLDA